MLTVPILPAFYFGSVEHYRLLARCEKAIIDTGEHYERQSYRNRTTIIGPNGTNDLVVQIARRSGKKMPVRSVGLSYAETWPQQHLHAIRSAYGQTPWFVHYIDEIEQVILQKYERLVDLDMATIRLGMKWLGVKTELVVSEEYVVQSSLSDVLCGPEDPGRIGHRTSDNSTTLDLRTSFHPKKPLPSEVTPVRPYTQVFTDRHGFIPRLSIIDVVCNCGPEAGRIIRS